MSKALPIPDPVQLDPNSLEMIRVWIAQERLHTALNVGFWEQRGIDEAEAWGMLLADTVRHIANAHQEEFGHDPRETIHAIAEALQRELSKPTTEVSGTFVGNRAQT